MHSSNFGDSLEMYELEDIKTGIHISNIRSTLDLSEVSDLKESIMTFGLQSPLTVMESEIILDDGSVEEATELVSGHKRLEAIKLIKKESPQAYVSLFPNGVPCVDFRGSVADAVLVNAAENLQRSNPKESDICKWIKARVDDGYTQKEVSTFINKSEDYVSQRMAIMNFGCDFLHDCLDNGDIKFSSAFKLAQVFKDDHAAQETFLREELKRHGNISLKSVRTAAANKKGKPKLPTKSEVLSIKHVVERAQWERQNAGKPDSDLLKVMQLFIDWQFGLGPKKVPVKDITDIIDNEK